MCRKLWRSYHTQRLRLALLLVLVGLLVSLSACTDAEAPASEDYYTEFHHVDLAVDTNGDVQVTEVLKYVFPQGSFRRSGT